MTDDTDRIEETLVLGPGMSVSRFASGEVVFTIEDEEGYRVAANASMFDSNHWVVELRDLLARCQGKAIQPKVRT